MLYSLKRKPRLNIKKSSFFTQTPMSLKTTVIFRNLWNLEFFHVSQSNIFPELGARTIQVFAENPYIIIIY